MKKQRVKNALIRLKSRQFTDEDSSEIELVTEGKYCRTDKGFEITYEETDATGFDGSRTVISALGDNYASMTRSGASSSDLVMDLGHKHHCRYNTPFGEMSIGIYTQELKNSLGDEGGELYFKYTVDVNASYMYDNEVFVNVETRP